MKQQLFLTRRAVPLPEWRLAFPQADIRGYPARGEKLSVPVGALVWLHIDNREKKPAALVAGLMESVPGHSVIVLSNVPSDDQGLAVLEAGASGYTGALAVADVLRQIETVVENGGLWVGPDLLQRLLLALGKRGTRPEASGQLDRLSPREREVTLAVAAGATNKEIAQRLDITERTVKAHLHHVFEILKVRDRLQLSILVNGLPSPPILH